MEDNGGLAKTGPGMLTSSVADQMIFPLHADLDQAHVILFLEWPQGQDSAEDLLRREKRWPCFLRGPIVVIS